MNISDKIRKIDALIKSTRCDGERQAATVARERLVRKLGEPKVAPKVTPKVEPKPIEIDPAVKRERDKFYYWLIKKGRRPDIAETIADRKFKDGIPDSWIVFPENKWRGK